MKLMRYVVLAALLAAPLPALAQNAAPTATPAPSPAKPASQGKSDAAPPDIKKQKKPRSEAQKKNDESMRACGQEWRAAKAANKTGGKSWREFSTECRRKKKAGG